MGAVSGFPHIFTPLRVGSVTVPNRLFVTAHSTQFVEEDPSGFHRWAVLGDRARAYYEDRAKGGFGLQIIGQTQVHPQAGTDRASSFSPEAQDAYRRIADACHAHGSKVFVQLNHNGRERGSTGPDMWEPMWSPSAIPAGHGEMTKPMDREDIAKLIAGFVTSARICRDAGMDGVEVHAAHPHLLGVWLVPAFNRRTDEYGGSLGNRLRLVLEVIEAVRQACGSQFAIGARINGAWTMPGGQPVEDTRVIAETLEATGQIDYLDVSGWPGIGSIGTPFGNLIEWAREVKQVVATIPVLGVGRVVRPEQAEDILARGDVDMVGMTRASIADPELPEKARSGRAAEVRVCVGAGQGCLMRNRERRPLTCQQNPSVGREAEWGIGTLSRSARDRHVLVVGSGPGGLEAAVTAGQRGHQVTLVERDGGLGGQVRLITRNPRREEFNRIVEWRVGQLGRLGVTVILSTAATRDWVLGIQPDAVVIATGSTPRTDGWYPAAPHLDHLAGFHRPHVATTWSALSGSCDDAGHVVVIDAHGYHHTADVVEYLAARSIRTTVICAAPIFAPEVDDHDRPDVMRALRDRPVELVTGAVVEAIGPTDVSVRDLFRARVRVVDAVDRVVLSTGQTAEDNLYQQLRGHVAAVHRVGDCVTPRGIEHAIFEGHKVGRSI